jgi:hypothetical protein
MRKLKTKSFCWQPKRLKAEEKGKESMLNIFVQKRANAD